MKIGMLVDFMGGGGRTPEEEYAEIEEMFSLALNHPTTFVRNVQPHQLSNESFDVYVFDYGGLAPGSGSLFGDMMHELHRQIEDHPNTLFVIWSSFTGMMYEALLRQETKLIENQHNLVIANGLTDELEDKIKAFL